MKMFSNLNSFNKIFYKCFSICKLFYDMATFYNFVYEIFCKLKLLLWTFMNLIRIFCAYVWFQLFYDCTGATSWDYMEATTWEPKRRKVPHIVQSAMYKSLCFGSLSVVILILIVLYDIYVLDQYWVYVLSVHTIFLFCFWPGHWDYRWHYVTWANLLFSVYVIYDLLL